jgi:hypothetical protein
MISKQDFINESVQKLQAQGADTKDFLSVGVSFATKLCREDEAQFSSSITHLTEFALTLHQQGIELWNPFHFGVRSLGNYPEIKPANLKENLDLILNLLLSLHRNKMEYDLSLQKGIVRIPENVNFELRHFQTILKFSKNLAEKKCDSDRYLEFAPAICQIVCGGESEDFSSLAQAIEYFVLTLESKGIRFNYGIAVGLSNASLAFSEEPAEYIAFLSDCLELVDVLRSRNLSVGNVFEYGFLAYRCFQTTRKHRDIVLETALALGSVGTSPTPVLSVYILDSVLRNAEVTLPFYSSMARNGIDSSSLFFRDATWESLLKSGVDSSSLGPFLSIIEKIYIELKNNGTDPTRLFENVLPNLINTSAIEYTEILKFTLEVAQKGFNPANVIQNGLLVSLNSFRKNPDALMILLKLGRSHVQAGISPVALLHGGALSGRATCGKNPEKLGVVFNRIHQLIIQLSESEKNPEQLFNKGILHLAESIGCNPDTFLGFLDYLENSLKTFKEHGVPSDMLLTNILLSIKNDNRFEMALGVGLRIALRFSKNSNLDLSEIIKELLPLLMKLSSSIVEAEVLMIHFEKLFFANADMKFLVSVFQGLVSLNDQADFTYESILHILEKLTELNLESVVNKDFILETSAYLARFTNDEVVRIFEILKSLEVGQKEVEVQQDFFKFILPSVMKIAANELQVLIQSSALIKNLVGKKTGGVVSIFIAEKCESMTAYLETIQKNDLSFVEDPLYQNYPLTELAGEISKVTQTPVEFINFLKEMLKITDPRFFSSIYRYDNFYSALSLLSNTGPKKDYMKRYRTFHTLAQPSISQYYNEVIYSLCQLWNLFKRMPECWGELIEPLPGSQGKGSSFILRIYLSLARYLTKPNDLPIIKYIVTQCGVRAVDIFKGFLLTALEKESVTDLAGDSKIIQEFIEEISINDYDFFMEYLAIHREPNLSVVERRQKIQNLRKEFEEIHLAIVRGSVTKEMEENISFFRIMYYVFPPSYSVPASNYQSLYSCFPDHTEHVIKLGTDSKAPEASYQFSEGGYVLRSGEVIQKRPWDFVLHAVNKSKSVTQELTLLKLGEHLFLNWVQNELNVETKVTLTALIYKHYLQSHSPLDEDLNQINNIFKIKSFIEDAAQEVIHISLGEYFQANPERFLTYSRNKIIPMKIVGKGLKRSIDKTITDYELKKIDSTTAQERMKMQLKGFDCRQPNFFSILLSSTLDKRQEIYNALKAEAKDVDPGLVYLRVFQDILGDIASQMNRELFGNGEQSPKVEYQKSVGEESLKVRFQVTKNKAHAAVGLAEGVCTASDLTLWSKPNFMQIVFWGPDQRSYGGMHVLLAYQDGKTYLTLPGINPTTTFLKKVRAQDIFNQTINFAKMLKEIWNLDGIWIPVNPSIHSNRSEIHQVIQDLKLPIRAVNLVEFSQNPYRYDFSEVFEIS